MRKIYIADSACVDDRLMQVADVNPTAALVWPWFLLSLDDWGRRCWRRQSQEAELMRQRCHHAEGDRLCPREPRCHDEVSPSRWTPTTGAPE